MTGNWFVVYPQEKTDNESQDKLYAVTQDSIVDEKGLKLISFMDNGEFIQWDSTILRGRWGIMDESRVVVSGAGKGFQNFKTVYADGENDEALLTKNLNINGERLQLEWHLKKINSGDALKLFGAEANSWRNKPTAPESEEAMKKRLSQMLAYYGIYFKLISEASSYFMPKRVMLPITFYQHAIGIKEFDEEHRFNSLFYQAADTRKGYQLLTAVLNSADFDYPDKDKNSYSLEYSYMLTYLSKEILK